MPVTICPVCNTRMFYDKYNTDFNHDCTESTITRLQQEDRFNINDKEWNMQGLDNKLFAKTAGIRGNKVLPTNRRAHKTSTITSRDRLTHIDVQKGTYGSNPL